MDIVADMLFQRLVADYPAEIAATQLRPPMLRVFARLGTRGFRNADRLLNRFYYYPHWLRKRRAEFDLFHIIDHSYAHLALELPPERTLITCHDVDAFRPLLEPDPHAHHGWFRHFTRRILDGFQRVSHIACVSEATRDAVVRKGLVPHSRTSVVHNGVHPDFLAGNPAADAGIARLLPPSQEGEIYLLSVGSTIPRKRIDVLLRTFAAVHRQAPTTRLVRVGGPFTESQAQLVNELGISGSVVELPFLEIEELAAVYRRAALLLQTSEAEGFGLPLIEAMSCGCPVVASDIPALREIGGPGITLCPVADVDRWTSAVLRLLREKSESPRAWLERVDDSVAWAARFDWSETAQRTVEIYRQLLAQ
jgi:glycosyltransferase involved in cell wall biosynthesis